VHNVGQWPNLRHKKEETKMNRIQIIIIVTLFAHKTCSVGIDLKELEGGQRPKCLEFCLGIEVYGRFSLKNERL